MDGHRKLLFVLGAGRSGTSAVTRMLSLCGAASPAGMLGANAGNPRGYWEPRAVVHLNEVLLRRHGSAQYDPRLRDGLHSRGDVAEIGKFIATLPEAPLVVIKDPRITFLSTMWFEAARHAGFDVAVVIAVRHPQEVVDSVAAKAHVSPELSSALWLKYVLLAERGTRGIPRVFVEYANLMDDWRRELGRICTALDVDLGVNGKEVEEFLSPTLRHQHYSGAVAEPFGSNWMSDVYGELSAAARDAYWSLGILDRVFEEYRARQAFWTVFEDFHRFHGFNRLIPPALGRWAGEIAALAHGRRGAWA